MLWEEKERNLIEDFKLLATNNIVLLSEWDLLEDFLNIILDEEEWKKWKDSSAKSDLPPDFYNDNKKIMMEVMRVDDHGYRKYGKTRNPLREKEHKIERELKELGLFENFPNAQLIINAPTNLPTEEDHNYNRYYKEFQRTVQQHIDNIENYRKNHKGYKLVLFIYDESTGYIEKDSESENSINGGLHEYFIDKKFVECFINADVDYVIWMAPYKVFFTSEGIIELPKAAIYAKGNLIKELVQYQSDRMVSAEK